jgi:sn-glycerol 3-phosphate transport system ATP-binding protein
MEVEVVNVSKSWGNVRAVDQVSFTAHAGELLVVLGPSGCGKSTILRLIAGLEAISSGTVRIAGVDVTALPPDKRNLSMVFQSYALFPHLNVAENIIFGLKVRKVPPAERRRHLDRVVALLGLQDLLHRKPSEISGGQRQRVALGRAIVSDARVCLMDEPLSNLDAKLRHEMRREIRTLQQRLEITMIYVTHDQVEAMTMADKIVLLNSGRIDQLGPPDEIYAQPATLFAAGFIGTPPMNLIPLKALGTDCRSDARMICSFPEGPPEAHVLGVRPESIHMADSGLAATVTGLEYLGADTLVTCKTGDCDVIVRKEGKARLAAGDRVHLCWSEADAHWFRSP